MSIDIVRGPGETVTINGIKVWPITDVPASEQEAATLKAEIRRYADMGYAPAMEFIDALAETAKEKI